MPMGPDIMVSPALMDTIPALTDTIPPTLIKPIRTARMGKLIDAITRLTVVATATGKSPRDLVKRRHYLRKPLWPWLCQRAGAFSSTRAKVMRSVLALGLLIALYASADATPAHHVRTHHHHVTVRSSQTLVPAYAARRTLQGAPPAYNDPSRFGGHMLPNQ
jgi:hypothetical protein